MPIKETHFDKTLQNIFTLNELVQYSELMNFFTSVQSNINCRDITGNYACRVCPSTYSGMLMGKVLKFTSPCRTQMNSPMLDGAKNPDANSQSEPSLGGLHTGSCQPTDTFRQAHNSRLDCVQTALTSASTTAKILIDNDPGFKSGFSD